MNKQSNTKTQYANKDEQKTQRNLDRAFLIASRSTWMPCVCAVPKLTVRCGNKSSHGTKEITSHVFTECVDCCFGRKFATTLLLLQHLCSRPECVENKIQNTKPKLHIECTCKFCYGHRRLADFFLLSFIYASGYASILIFANSEWHPKTSSSVNKWMCKRTWTFLVNEL